MEGREGGRKREEGNAVREEEEVGRVQGGGIAVYTEEEDLTASQMLAPGRLR